MVISLLGYMGSGKTHISKLLSSKLNFKLIDLDFEIVTKEQMPVADIFEKKGEIYFRKQERLILENILHNHENTVLSLGGGTPVYYDNMDFINKASTSFYLSPSIKTLYERLSRGKEKRPLIARIPDEDLPEFIAKHLFERSPFYSKAQYTIYTDNKSAEEIVAEITNLLPFH